MKAKYIALDCESGGLTTKTSLLTIYLQILDNDFNTLDSLDLKVKPADGIYITTVEALTVNGIDLKAHDKQAVHYEAAGKSIRDLLIRHSNAGKAKIIPVGHNVTFDLEFMYHFLLNKKEAQNYVSYRLLDTGVIAQFLKTCGLIPESVTGSLKSLVDHFQIPAPETHGGKFHTADMDTFMTVEVLKCCIALINKTKVIS